MGSYPTVSPLPLRAVCSLLQLMLPHDDLAVNQRSVLGAPTFLCTPPCSDRPTYFRAIEGTRTPTPFRALPPQSSASTNSATIA